MLIQDKVLNLILIVINFFYKLIDIFMEANSKSEIKNDNINQINLEIETKLNIVDNNDQKITPWEVCSKGKIDYMRLVSQFGTELIDDALLNKFKRITGKDLHPWLKRGIFFSHREFNTFLDAYENGDPVFLYTGRGPTTDAMHVGHLIPFMFSKWLQDVFDCPFVIQISDEEKAAFKKLDFNSIYKQGFENAKEIISLGFNFNVPLIFFPFKKKNGACVML